LTCPEFVEVRLQAFTRRSNDPDGVGRATDALRTCRARLVAHGIDPDQYNFDTAAQDVLDLMYVLKIPRANFVAFELVAAEVFDVLRRAPGAVRSLTLDNPPPPGVTLLSDPIGDFSGAFDRFVALCHADRTCAGGYPDLAAKWKSGNTSFARKPVLAAAPNPFGSSPPALRVLLDGPRTADALAVALASSDPSGYALIPPGIARTGSDDILASLVLQEDRLVPDAPWGAQASYWCAYDIHTTDPQGAAFAARTLPQFVRADYAGWAQWCTGWKVADVSSELSADVVSDVPTLIFRGDLSP